MNMQFSKKLFSDNNSLPTNGFYHIFIQNCIVPYTTDLNICHTGLPAQTSL